MTEALFGDRQHLRELLLELCTDPDRSWRTDAEAAALMGFCAGKYAALARAYGQSPHDAAVAGWRMRSRGGSSPRRSRPTSRRTSARTSNWSVNAPPGTANPQPSTRL